MKDLVVAEHDDADIHQAKAGTDLADHEREARSAERGARVAIVVRVRAPRSALRAPAYDFAEPLAFRLVVAGDDYAVAGGGVGEFLAQLGDVAAETLDGLDPEMAGGFHRRSRQRRDARVRKAQQLLEHAVHGEQAPRVGDPLQIMPALLVEVVRLDQHGPGVGREILTEMARITELLAVVRSAAFATYQFDCVRAGQAALRFWRELADGFQLVAEEFQTIGCVGVWREDIENAAAARELARQMDGIRPLKAAVHQPGR